MCSNASITEILGINDNNLVILGNEKENIKEVEYVTTDMYRPYIDLAKKVFPNANIIVDKFHIVQLLARELNKLRINEMKKLNTRSKEYKILKRYWKISLTKNRNFKARIMLMERYKIQKGNIYSYKFAMDTAP